MRPSRFPHLSREARRFLRRHSEYADDMTLERDPETGETVAHQRRDPEVDPTTDRRTSSYSGWSVGEDEEGGGFEEALEKNGVRFPWGKSEDDGVGPGYDLEQRIMAVRVQRILQLMPKNDANLLRERFLEGRTQAELAGQRGVSQQAVAGAERRAKQSFMRVMGERFRDVWPVDPEEL